RSTRCVSRSVVIPPIPEPMRTPNRVPSTLSVSSAASWTAMAAHAIAYWRKGSRRRASFLSTKSSGSKFFTSPAMRVGKPAGSNFVIGPTPERPCSSADQNSSAVLPTGVRAPSPVRTTRGTLTPYELSLMYWIASPTVTIFSASSSGIWMSKCSSSAITSSTVSRESAPRSSMNFAVGVTSSSSTPSCSTMISFTFSSTGFAMNRSPPPKGELHIETAVDVEHLARDVGRPVSGEESYHLGHLEHPIPVLILHPPEQLIVRDAGVVDEDIDTSELLSRRAHEAIAIVTTHHVGDDAERRVSLRFQVLHHPLQSVAVAPRDYHGR